MPDEDTMLLQGQQELLRQIRDELHASRNATGGVAANGVGGSAAYTQFRSTMDQMASSQWGNGAWANAYKTQISQSTFGELAGALGFARAPNTMTQMEYQTMSAEMLGVRVASIPGAILAPTFSSNARSMADDLYSFSPRFARFGDSMAGPAGSGISFSSARQIARDLQVAAAGDLRLNGKDYSTIMQTGLASGQFDKVGSTDELIAKFTQLKDTIADLTRVTRMTTGEMSGFMGQLRQAGVQDIGDQRRVTENLAATARVAGISMGEMAPGAANAIQSGLGMGLSAITSASLYGSNMAAARTMGRNGTISANLLAQAGGSSGYAAAITQAQQNFLAGPGAILAMMGGGGRGGFLPSMMGGLNATGGNLDAIMAMQTGGADIMDDMSGDQGAALVDSMIKQQADMLGGGAGREQAAAYNFYLKNGSSKAQAQAAARKYSLAGRASMAQQAFSTAGAKTSMDAAGAYDDYYMNSSAHGLFHRGAAYVRSGFAGMVAGMENSMSAGQDGYMFGLDSAADQQLNAVRMGTAADNISLGRLAAGFNIPAKAVSPADPNYYLTDPSVGAATGGFIGSGVGAALGGYASTYGAAGALGMVGLAGTPMGWAALGGLAIAGAAGGLYGGAVLGGSAGGAFMSAHSQISREQHVTLQAIRQARNTSGSQAGREALNQLAGDRRFQSLMATYGSGASLDIAQTKNVADSVSGISKQYGISAGDITSAMLAAGGALNVSSGYQSYGGLTDSDFNNQVLNGVSATANFQTTEASAALADLLASSASGDQNRILRARGAVMNSANTTTGDMATLLSNIGGLSNEAKKSFAALSNKKSEDGASIAVDRQLGGIYNYLDGRLTGGAAETLHGLSDNKLNMLNALKKGGALSEIPELTDDRNIQTLQAILNTDTSRDRHGYAKALGMSPQEYEKMVGKGNTQNSGYALAAFTSGLSSQTGSPDGILSKAVNQQLTTTQILDRILKQMGSPKDTK